MVGPNPFCIHVSVARLFESVRLWEYYPHERGLLASGKDRSWTEISRLMSI